MSQDDSLKNAYRPICHELETDTETVTYIATGHRQHVEGGLNRGGRPRLAESVCQVTLTMPTEWYDACCREALARDVPASVVLREAILSSRRQRGDL